MALACTIELLEGEMNEYLTRAKAWEELSNLRRRGTEIGCCHTIPRHRSKHAGAATSSCRLHGPSPSLVTASSLDAPALSRSFSAGDGPVGGGVRSG
uniref:Uncharacterized protein n=1 Tax=Arundo donax TaxID=35708 RepID=A0A0A9FSU7_ARUDO